MNEPDRAERMVKVMGVLAEAFRQKITSVTIQAYEMGLEGVPMADIERAAKRAIGERRFFPVPAELRELAGDAVGSQRAVLAWGAVKEAIARHGYYKSVDFDDQTINATIRNMGGWMPLIEQLDEEGDKWPRKDFERIYTTLAATGIGPELAGPLLGCHERENRNNGYPDAVKPPVLVETGLPVRKRIETQKPKSLPAIAGLLESTLKSANP